MSFRVPNHFRAPVAAPSAVASPCVSSGSRTRMPIVAFGDAPNHPYALARRPMR